mgnify:FL=1
MYSDLFIFIRVNILAFSLFVSATKKPFSSILINSPSITFIFAVLFLNIINSNLEPKSSPTAYRYPLYPDITRFWL